MSSKNTAQLLLLFPDGRQRLEYSNLPATGIGVVVGGQYQRGLKHRQNVPIGRLVIPTRLGPNQVAIRVRRTVFEALDARRRSVDFRDTPGQSSEFSAQDAVRRYRWVEEAVGDETETDRLEAVAEILSSWPYLPDQRFSSIDVWYHSLILELVDDGLRLAEIRSRLEAYLENREARWSRVEWLAKNILFAPFTELREPLCELVVEAEKLEYENREARGLFAFRDESLDHSIHCLVDRILAFIRRFEFGLASFWANEVARSMAWYLHAKPEFDGQKHFVSAIESVRKDVAVFAEAQRLSPEIGELRKIDQELARVLVALHRPKIKWPQLAEIYDNACWLMASVYA